MSAVCKVQLKEKKRIKGLIKMLGSTDTMNQLAMANSMYCYWHLLRIKYGHVFKKALQLEVEG